MSQMRRLKRELQKRHNSRLKRQKTIFSFSFILTIIISFTMLALCAINRAPTITTTLISGCFWLLFDIIFAYAIKNKWRLLSDECSTGRISFDSDQTEAQRKKDNWQGNCFKFALSVIILLVHIVLLFCFLFDF